MVYPLAALLFVLALQQGVVPASEQDLAIVLTLLSILTIASSFSFGANNVILREAAEGSISKSTVIRAAGFASVAGWAAFLAYGRYDLFLLVLPFVFLAAWSHPLRVMAEARLDFWQSALLKITTTLVPCLLAALCLSISLKSGYAWLIFAVLFALCLRKAIKTNSRIEWGAQGGIWRASLPNMILALHATLFFQSEKFLAAYTLPEAEFVNLAFGYELLSRLGLVASFLLVPIYPRLFYPSDRARLVRVLVWVIGCGFVISIILLLALSTIASKWVDLYMASLPLWEYAGALVMISLAITLQRLCSSSEHIMLYSICYATIFPLQLLSSSILMRYGEPSAMVLAAKAAIEVIIILPVIILIRISRGPLPNDA